MSRRPLLRTGAMPANARQRRRRARRKLEALMTATRADLALADARSLIENRTRWPAAPLIGAGERWLRPGVVATMAGALAETEEAMAAVRAATRPMGILDALGFLDSHADFIAGRVAELRALDQDDAAMALEAETAMPGDVAWHKLLGQFAALAMARVKAERPPVPPWIDGMGRRRVDRDGGRCPVGERR